MKIALDTFGGDNAPEATIEGARLALCEADQLAQADFKIVLVGNKASIKPLLNQNNQKQF